MLKPISICVIVFQVLIGQVSFAEEEDIFSLREKAENAIQTGEWKAAKKAISAFKKLGKKEVAMEAKQLSLWLKSRQALVKIVKDFDKGKLSAKKALKKLLAMRAKADGIKKFKREYYKPVNALTRKVYTLIDNFESRNQTVTGDDWERVSHPHRYGSFALKWLHTDISSSNWWAYSENTPDWRKHEALTFYCYAKKPGQIFTVTVWDNEVHGYMASIKVTWKGWKQVRLPLHGKKSAFQGTGTRTRKDASKKWSKITSIGFFKPEGLSIDVVVDDICLEKKTKK